MLAEIAPVNLAGEIADGDRLTPPELARRIGVNPATAYRWVLKGIPDRHGGRIRLEALRRGRVYITSFAAYRRFLQQHPTNATSDAAEPRRESSPIGRTASQREKASAAAADELRLRHGI